MVLSLLPSTFLTVFIAELGDKTQLATLTISGTSNKPLAVFLGSSSALVFASLLGALTGGSISSFLPEVVLKSIASITFFIIGIRLFINSFTIEKEEKEEKENNYNGCRIQLIYLRADISSKLLIDVLLYNFSFNNILTSGISFSEYFRSFLIKISQILLYLIVSIS